MTIYAVRVTCDPLPPPVPESFDVVGTRGTPDACAAANPQAVAGDPVNTYTGNYHYDLADLSVPARGLTLTWQRAYNTQEEDAWTLGPKWTGNYLSKVKIAADGAGTPFFVTVVDDVGNHYVYYPAAYDAVSQTQHYTTTAGIRAELIGYTPVVTQTPSAFQWLKCDGQWSHYTLVPNRYEAHLEEIGDSHGNVLTLGYDADDAYRLSTVSASSGPTLTISYNGQNLISQVEASTGASVSYAYDANGRLQTVTDVRGGTMQFQYDALNRTAVITDANGYPMVHNWYDELGRVSQQQDAEGHLTTFQYPAGASGTATVTTPRWVRKDDYSDGKLVAQWQCAADGSNCRRYLRLEQYDDNLNPTQVYNIRNESATLTMDAASHGSRLTDITDVLGNQAHFEYDATPSHNLLHATGPGDWQVDLSYDVAVRTHTAPGGVQFALTDTNLSTISDALDHDSYLEHDGYGQTTAVTDANGHTVRLAYDAFGNTTVITDAAGQATTLSYTYDSSGQHVTLIRPAVGGASTQNRYDYDPAGNLVRTVENYQDGERGPGADQDVRTDSTYDAVGNLIAATDPQGHVTNITYDSLNRPTTVTVHGDGAESAEWQFGYDADGNVTSMVDPNGQQTTAQYDVFNRPTSVSYPGWGTAHLDYDDVNRTVTVRDPAERATVYTYDALQRMTDVRDAANRTTHLSYDAFGDLLELTDANGIKTRSITCGRMRRTRWAASRRSRTRMGS